ncbi:hypothetical protein FQZ97_1278640 [compost metagenome]
MAHPTDAFRRVRRAHLEQTPLRQTSRCMEQVAELGLADEAREKFLRANARKVFKL